MSLRRILWLCLSALLAWGLYLYLPPKPAWILDLPQVPLYFSKTHMVTAAVRKSAPDEVPWIEYGRFSRNTIVGPVCLRDIAAGNVVGSALESGETCVTLEISADLRFLLTASLDGQSFAVHDLATGERWRPADGAQMRFAPRGTLMWAATRASALSAGALYETASKQLVLQVDWPYLLMEIADDDSWALFFKTVGDDTETLLWRRGEPQLRRATLPGVVMQWRLAGDKRTLTAHCVDPQRIVVWDVPTGATRRQVKLSFAKSDLSMSLDDDGHSLAVWAIGSPGLEFVQLDSGQVTKAPHAHVGSWHGFSRAGRQFAFLESGSGRGLVVLDSVTGQTLWSEAQGAYATYDWVSRGENLLVTSAAATLRRGATGANVGVRDRGTLSDDRQVLVSHDLVSIAEALKLPESLGRWMPFLTVKDQLRVRVTEVDTGHRHFQFLRKRGDKSKEATIRWPHVARDRLVLVHHGGAAEIWNLPPAKRWLWILGPPLGLAALPWLSSMIRRKRSAPTAGPLAATASLPPAPAPAHPVPPSC